MLTTFEEACLRECIALADRHQREGYFPYAAMLVRGEEVVEQALHGLSLPASSRDLPIAEPPLAHPELILVERAWALATQHAQGDSAERRTFLASLTMVSNVEPCGMCSRAMAGAFISNMVFAIDTESALRSSGCLGGPRETIAEIYREYGLDVQRRGPFLREEALKGFSMGWQRALACGRNTFE